MKNTLALAVVFLLINSNLEANVCVLSPVETLEIEGYLVFGYKNEYGILEKGEVYVSDKYDYKHIIASANIDHNGYFKIEGVKPGKYSLSGHSDGLVDAYGEIKVIKSKKDSSKKLILIVVAADIGEVCAGTSITMHPYLEIEAMLQTATRPK